MDRSPVTNVVGLPRSLHVSSRRIGLVLIVAVGCLVTAQLGVLVMKYAFGNSYAWGLAGLFRMNSEGNIPALTSSMLMMLCGLMALVTAGIQPRGLRARLPWLILGGVMIFLAYDEGARLHERLGDLLYTRLQADWLPRYTFLVPYGLAMALLAAILLPWFIRLDRSSQVRFVIAGTLFVTGAAVFEMLEVEHLASAGQSETPLSDALVTVEETLEFSGVGFFLHALVRRLGGLTFSASGSPAASVPAASSYAASSTMRETSAA